VPTLRSSRSNSGPAARHHGSITAQVSSDASAMEFSQRRGCSPAACQPAGKWWSPYALSSSVTTSTGRSRSRRACSVADVSVSGEIGTQNSGMEM
jgi:hypothetical protein